MKKKIIYAILAILAVVGIMYVAGNINAPSTNRNAKEHAAKALEYCKSNGLRTDYCILVDFSVHLDKKNLYPPKRKPNTYIPVPPRRANTRLLRHILLRLLHSRQVREEILKINAPLGV